VEFFHESAGLQEMVGGAQVKEEVMWMEEKDAMA
jgi:hypothetical protein